MLITCPECDGKISDKATTCPHCGYPIVKKHTYRRLPNGFGCIKRLSGNRRRPYMALPPVKDYTDNGSPIYGTIIGYFETYDEAYASIVEFKKNGTINRETTVAMVFDEWFADKFVKNKQREYSTSMMRSAKSSFENCHAIHNKAIKSVKLNDLQRIWDNCTLKRASQEMMLTTIHQVFEYAIKHDYIEKDYSQYIQIRIKNDDEKGVPFTESEIKALWDNKDDKYVRIILILIYTGFRISELKTVTLDYERKCFVGGLKTSAGKNRSVPIHNAIWDFCTEFNPSTFDATRFRQRHFYPIMKDLGMEYAENGARHTPHDCRHTFSWLCDKCGVDNVAKHLIMGHALTGDVEATVYKHRTYEELAMEIDKLVTIIKK